MALRTTLLTIRAGSSALHDLAEQYLVRCAREFRAELRSMRSEAAALHLVQEAKKRDAAAFWIADPPGQALTTEALAERVRNLRDAGRRQLILAVGPADGWSETARAAADLRLSLSAMTLPHELAALVLAEQIYRVSTILQGHPYHLGH